MLSIGALRTVCDRREMINEKMKILQDLVPGCNKVIGKELIINYMQLLQHQVEMGPNQRSEKILSTLQSKKNSS
ncbi:unnamed protein product [Camellia sinensis]